MTVVVHAHKLCALEKTYEAQLNDVPPTFSDGSVSAGRGVHLERLGPSWVSLTLAHAGMRLILRQHGDALSVALRVPSSVVGDSRQLCLGGCPAREKVMAVPPNDVRQWQRDEAEAACRSANLSGPYWDVCLFDVFTMGLKAWAAAAGAAVADLRELGAATPVRLELQRSPGGAAAPSSSSPLALVVVAVVVLACSRCWERPPSCLG